MWFWNGNAATLIAISNTVADYVRWYDEADNIRHPPAKAQFMIMINICHGSVSTK